MVYPDKIMLTEIRPGLITVPIGATELTPVYHQERFDQLCQYAISHFSKHCWEENNHSLDACFADTQTPVRIHLNVSDIQIHLRHFDWQLFQNFIDSVTTNHLSRLFNAGLPDDIRLALVMTVNGEFQAKITCRNGQGKFTEIVDDPRLAALANPESFEEVFTLLKVAKYSDKHTGEMINILKKPHRPRRRFRHKKKGRWH